MSNGPPDRHNSEGEALSDVLARDRIYFRRLFETTPEGIVILDNSDRILDANPAWLALFGYHLEEVRGRTVNECIVPRDRYQEGSGLSRKALSGDTVETESRRARKDGSQVDVSIVGVPIVVGGNREGVYGIYRDISARKRAEESQRLASAALESSAEGVAILDADFRIVSVNRAFGELTGWDRTELAGRTLREAGFSDALSPGAPSLREALEVQHHWQAEIWNRRRDGDEYPALVSLSTVADEAGGPSHYVCVFNDVSESLEVRNRLEFLTHHDPLTELPNRTLFTSQCENALLRARRHQNQVGLLLIDLDQFKNINDSLGHEVGDRLLIAAGKRLQETLRSVDAVARLGGDEFAVLIEDAANADEFARVAGKLLEAFARDFQLDGRSLTTSLSIGIASFPEDGEDVSTLMKNADAAMYQAKDHGRNTYHFFSMEMNQRAWEDLVVTDELRTAIREDHLEVHYQPIVGLPDCRIVALEALVRWHHPERGLIPPGEFIPVAERNGLIGILGDWVFQAVCRQVRSWQDVGISDLRVAVNISPRQLSHRGILRKLERGIADAGLKPGVIGLEVTESMMMQNPSRARRLLQAFSVLGISTAVDDFGTGYSSLGVLRDFPIDYLKIDRGFVQGLPEDAGSLAIVRAVIAMAHSLELRVIAEGVETAQQATLLAELGCDQAQGFYLARPAPAEEIEALLLAGAPLPSASA